MQVTLKERSPKRPASWAVKSQQQQSKKRNTDSDTNTSNGGHRGSNQIERFKQQQGGTNRKDHWATAKQHVLDKRTSNEESQILPREDDTRGVTKKQPNDSEIERRRRRLRKEDDSSSTVDGNTLISSRIEHAASRGSVADEARTGSRRVPRKLPLQQSSTTVAQPHSLWSDAETSRNSSAQISNKTNKQMSLINSDAQNCCDVVNETGSAGRMTRNGLRNWETECTSTSNGVEEAAAVVDVNAAVRNTTSVFAKPASGQWQPPPPPPPPPDDVQPCSSKTIDPYSFA